jgi:hypothetical protein
VVQRCVAVGYCSLIFFLNKKYKKIYNATTKRKITYTISIEERIRGRNEKQEG